MPELPEVETVVRELRTFLPGRDIVRASLTAPDLYRRDSRKVSALAGATIAAVERRGKAIVIRGTTGSPNLVVHLGMTGRLEWHAAGRAGPDASPSRAGQAPPGALARGHPRAQREVHLHARIHFGDGSELRYIDPRRFGFIFVGSDAECDASLCMGPDPFQMKDDDFARTLARRQASVKSLLLNQRIISGMGNIYVDEALFMVGIHPLTPGARASQHAAEILKSARNVLERAIRARGTTLRDYRRTDGSTGEFQIRLSVYGREGEACRRCGATIVRLEVAQRGTHVCPRCQRAPRVSASSRGAPRADRSRRAGPRRAGYMRSR
jgi:formamidopyrimidine-DNA glycosylase